MSYVYIKLPRFDGCKTIAFNGFVLVVSLSGYIWLRTGGSALPVGETAFALLATVALANGVLRVFSDGPVWWRRIDWAYDPAEGESETVYHKAAEFVAGSDFTDCPAGKGNAGFLHDLDRQLMGARKERQGDLPGLNGSFCDPGDAPELPLDADREMG